MDRLDNLQTHFVKSLGLTEEDAFTNFNLAPLCVRRDIGVLGLLHKIKLGLCHSDFRDVFLFDDVPRRTTRHNARRHAWQFKEEDGKTLYFNHSIFGAVKVYNVLPKHTVRSNSVKSLQRLLTREAKFQCQNNNLNWKKNYSCRYHFY